MRESGTRHGPAAAQPGTRSTQRLKMAAANRDFNSKAVRELLAERRIGNAIAPGDITVLRARGREARFCELQQHRGQTEAPIAIIKNGILGARRCCPKGVKIRRGRWRSRCLHTTQFIAVGRAADEAKKCNLQSGLRFCAPSGKTSSRLF